MPHPRYQLFITVQIFFRRCEAAVFLCVMSMGDAVGLAPSLPAVVVMKNIHITALFVSVEQG